MTLFCCLNEGIVYYVGLIPSRYYKVLVDKEKSAFFQLLGTSLFTVFLAGFVSVAHSLWGVCGKWRWRVKEIAFQMPVLSVVALWVVVLMQRILGCPHCSQVVRRDQILFFSVRQQSN